MDTVPVLIKLSTEDVKLVIANYTTIESNKTSNAVATSSSTEYLNNQTGTKTTDEQKTQSDTNNKPSNSPTNGRN